MEKNSMLLFAWLRLTLDKRPSIAKILEIRGAESRYMWMQYTGRMIRSWYLLGNSQACFPAPGITLIECTAIAKKRIRPPCPDMREEVKHAREMSKLSLSFCRHVQKDSEEWDMGFVVGPFICFYLHARPILLRWTTTIRTVYSVDEESTSEL